MRLKTDYFKTAIFLHTSEGLALDSNISHLKTQVHKIVRDRRQILPPIISNS